MDSLEYENIQAALRKKLHRGREGYSGNREEAYREGIRAAMSILSSQYKYQNQSVCPICGTHLKNGYKNTEEA